MPFAILMIGDLPMSLVAFGVMFTSEKFSWVAIVVWGSLGTLRWYAIGTAIDVRIRSYRENRNAGAGLFPKSVAATSLTVANPRKELLIAASVAALVVAGSIGSAWNGRQGHFEKGRNS